MENTLTMFEHHTEKKWFVAIDERLVGPVSGKEIALWVTGGELRLADFVWQEGFSSWKRIIELKDFQPLLPSEPNPALMAQARTRLQQERQQELTPATTAPLPPGAEQRIWFLFMNNAQYGPFSVSEVHLMVEAGRVNENTYLWKKGMTDWVPAAELGELGLKLGKPAKRSSKKGAEKRHTPRRPFEAKILLTDGQEVGWALCRDISIGGMQILMEHVPGEAGAQLKLNVAASGDIPAFVCDGEIVRVMEDGRGFSFRFLSLPAKAKAAIEKYIE